MALRYTAAAVAPTARRAMSAVRERVAPRDAEHASLKERLTAGDGVDGGRLGDAADAMLAKLGPPGKLASRAGLGSRAVARLVPTDEVPADEGDEEAREEPRASGEPDSSAEPDSAADPSSPAEPETEDEEPDEGAAVDDGSAEPATVRTGADPLQSRYEHAYVEDVENYEHEDAYGPVHP